MDYCSTNYFLNYLLLVIINLLLMVVIISLILMAVIINGMRLADYMVWRFSDIIMIVIIVGYSHLLMPKITRVNKDE